MLIEQPPLIMRWMFPRAFWRMDKHTKAVYLTFDDGPIPEVTPWVLDLLDHYQILDRGHRVGNHTYNHIRGLDYLSKNYLANVEKADKLIHSNLFRPPHGFMRWGEYMILRDKYQMVMWDVVTRDYSKRLSGPQVFEILKKYVRNGSIITFHDSLKSKEKLEYALPRSIEWLLNEGYSFKIFD